MAARTAQRVPLLRQHVQRQLGQHAQAGAEVRVVARQVAAAVDQNGGRLRLQHHDVRLRRLGLDDAPVVAPTTQWTTAHYTSFCLLAQYKPEYSYELWGTFVGDLQVPTSRVV